MNEKPLIIVDADIPFIQGRLEPFFRVVYVDQFGFTPELVRHARAMVIRTRTRCNAALLAGSDVEIIATATIGMDQFDLPWCHANGIVTRNAPGCNAPGVAQYVWSSLLRLGFSPEGKRIGVVGCGNVGAIVAQWGHLLGAEVIVSDPPKAEEGVLSYKDTPLDELLGTCDAVTLHVPMTKDGKHPTHHLIGARELALLKPGAILVNAARGPVVDNAAWVEALRKGTHRAVVDTWEGEPQINRELLSVADIATYHIAGYSTEGKQRATRMALRAIAGHFKIDVDLSGLAPDYTEPANLTAESITASFDPAPIMAELRQTPADFDRLRKEYRYRPEVR